MPLGTILKVMQNLLKEKVSIRDLRTILETLAEHGTTCKDAHVLTELVRQNLYRTITASIKSGQGDVPVYTLERKIEEYFFSNVMRQSDKGPDTNF